MEEKMLNQQKLKKYEDVLLLEKEQTQKIINGIDEIQRRGIKDRSGDLSSYSLHQADMGTDTDESEKRVYMLNKEMEKLKKLMEFVQFADVSSLKKDLVLYLLQISASNVKAKKKKKEAIALNEKL